MLRKGCTHMRRAFEIEDFNLDDLVATAMDDPEARSAKFKGVSFAEMHDAYNAVCKEAGASCRSISRRSSNSTTGRFTELPDHTRLLDLKLPATTTVLDRNGRTFAEVYEPANRRVPVKLSAISPLLQGAFIAAEDQRFREHKGVDERALIRAFVANIAGGETQGGSTITQQLAKNLLVGSENSYVRKMREMVVASRIEIGAEQGRNSRTLSQCHLPRTRRLGRSNGRADLLRQGCGRAKRGRSRAARRHGEGTDLLQPRPSPRSGPRAHGLRAQPDAGRKTLSASRNTSRRWPNQRHSIPRQLSRRTTGYHVVDYIRREARRVADIKLLSEDAFVIRSTLDARIQQAAESALQEGLASYERSAGRARFEGPEANLGDRINELASTGGVPRWQQALTSARLPLYDVQWPAAVILDKADIKGRPAGLWVGLADGRIVQLQVPELNPAKAKTLRRCLRAARGIEKGRHHSRASHTSTSAGSRGGFGKLNWPDPGDERGVFVSAEPAESCHTGSAPAGLINKAAHLSRSARKRSTADHAGARYLAHAAADWQIKKCAIRRVVVAGEL